mmetsp:Transcript_27036/g.27279  ORF Transcript_27036/g.27279 Transcript_27036/m.27279 type:complete len:118 (-) Transcript_27036:192-545(-)
MSHKRTSSASMKPMNVDDDTTLLDNVRYRARIYYNRGRPPPKTTFAAVFLLMGGVIFLTLGVVMFLKTKGLHNQDRGLAFLVLGGVMFLPGSYASTILFGAWRGWQGYEYDMVPSYD